MSHSSRSPTASKPVGRDTPIARRLADFAAGLAADQLPAPVVEAAKLHFLDALGVGLAAASLQTRPRIELAIGVLGTGAEATGIGLVDPIPAPSAALLNGSLIHALEFDDTHMAAVVHASAVVAPAALAVAERERRTGAQLLTAYVLGWEVLARIGLSGPTAFHARGFQSTAVAGAPVAALVAGSLAGGDVDMLCNAMGIAGSQAGGIFEFIADGSTVKMMHGGWPAHAGIVAVALAQAGLTGPATVFEGERGLLRAFTSDPDCAERFAGELDDLGTRWLIEQAAFKAYPCCHYLQAAIECLAGILARGLRAESISRVICELPEEVAWLVCEPWTEKLRPTSGHVAKFSLPYCLAAVMVDGDVDVDTFDRQSVDPRLVAMGERVQFAPMKHSGFPQRYAAGIRVETFQGGVYEEQVLDVQGSASRPFSSADVETKFRRNAGRLLMPEAVDAVVDAVVHLDTALSLDVLTSALRRHSPSRSDGTMR